MATSSNPPPVGATPDEKLRHSIDGLSEAVRKLADKTGTTRPGEAVGRASQGMTADAATPTAAQLLRGRESLSLLTPDLKPFKIRNDEDLERFRAAGGSVPPVGSGALEAHPSPSPSQSPRQAVEAMVRSAASPPQAKTPGDDWYARYRELQNRHDLLTEGGKALPEKDEAERQRLHQRLLEEADKPTPRPAPTRPAEKLSEVMRRQAETTAQLPRGPGGPTPPPRGGSAVPPMTPPTVVAYQGQAPPVPPRQAVQAMVQQAAAGQQQPSTPTAAPKPARSPGWFGRLRRSPTRRFVGGLARSVRRGVKSAAGNTRVGRAVGGLFGAGKKVAGAKAAGALGGAVGGAAGMAAAALIDLAKAGKDLAYSQEREMRRLAEVSPSQAANIALLDANRVLRDMQRGEDTAGSGAALAKSIDKFEKTLQPFLTFIDNLSNTVGSAVLDLLSDLLELLKPLLEVLKDIAEFLTGKNFGKKGDEGEVMMPGDWMAQKFQELEEKDRRARERVEQMRRQMAGF